MEVGREGWRGGDSCTWAALKDRVRLRVVLNWIGSFRLKGDILWSVISDVHDSKRLRLKSEMNLVKCEL